MGHQNCSGTWASPLYKHWKAGEEVFLLPVEGGQDKPFPAVTGTVIPSPSTPQRDVVTLFSQPSPGASQQATGCPCMHPLTQHGCRVSIPHGAATQSTKAQQGPSWNAIWPSPSRQGGHPPPQLLVTGPPTCSCLERGDNYFNVPLRSDARPLVPCPPTSQSLLPQFPQRGGHWEGGRRADGAELKLTTAASLPRAPGPSAPARTRVGVKTLKRS